MSETDDNEKEFLYAFVRELVNGMVSSGMIRVENNYPSIEKIKENIKIYEKPENTLANVILMNQTPAVQKLMQPFEIIKDADKQKANIVSMMGIPSLPSQVPMPRVPKPLQPRPQNRPNMNGRPPFSQPLPFMHKQSNMRMLPPRNNGFFPPVGRLPAQSSPPAPEKSPFIGFAKIDEILGDSAVQTVECPGPNKPVLVYKGGAVRSSKLTLTSDEINNIMKSVSEKTRIPLMSGVFKAAYGNLIITSVMSDFVGTRFMIQKKPQLPPQQPNSLYQQ